MATATVSGVRIVGMASAVPEAIAGVADITRVFGQDAALKVSEYIGVKTRRIASSDICASDLCEAATKRLMADLSWSFDSIDLVLFVTQTPDYRLPATACVLHGKLGMPNSCAALDVNLGCSGYVYGLWMTGQLMQSGTIRRALLLVGDTISRTISPRDRSSFPLFGDAGTVTALQIDAQAADMVFELGTDGGGAADLMIPAGGFRQIPSPETSVRTERDGGNIRSDEDLYMNGTEIFTFTLREVPKMLSSVLEYSGWEKQVVDAYVFHQANRFMLNHLVKRMKIDPDKTPMTIDRFGNTSSASIPLTMTEGLGSRLRTETLRLILAGFGVGLSWGSAAMSCGPIVVSPLTVVNGHRE